MTDEERQVIVDALRQHWNLTNHEAEFVADVAISEPAMQLDRYRLAREFAGDLPHGDAVKFVDVLFAIATADGHASVPEIEEIRHISASLKLFNKEFIEAKNARPQGETRRVTQPRQIHTSRRRKREFVLFSGAVLLMAVFLLRADLPLRQLASSAWASRQK